MAGWVEQKQQQQQQQTGFVGRLTVQSDTSTNPSSQVRTCTCRCHFMHVLAEENTAEFSSCLLESVDVLNLNMLCDFYMKRVQLVPYQCSYGL